MTKRYLDLWGEKLEIQHSEQLHVQKNNFALHEIKASDDTSAVVLVSNERVTKNTNDVISLIRRTLEKRGLRPVFVKNGTHFFLDAIHPLDKEIKHRFHNQRTGIIALINGHEPETDDHVHALDEMTLHRNDRLTLLYRIGSSDE